MQFFLPDHQFYKYYGTIRYHSALGVSLGGGNQVGEEWRTRITDHPKLHVRTEIISQLLGRLTEAVNVYTTA